MLQNFIVLFGNFLPSYQNKTPVVHVNESLQMCSLATRFMKSFTIHHRIKNIEVHTDWLNLLEEKIACLKSFIFTFSPSFHSLPPFIYTHTNLHACIYSHFSLLCMLNYVYLASTSYFLNTPSLKGTRAS